MNAYDWIRCEGDDRARLVRDADAIAHRLPPPSEGSLVASTQPRLLTVKRYYSY